MTGFAPQAGDKPIPESLGLAVGVVFLVHVILFQQFVFFQDGDREWMVEYNAALATVCAGPAKAMRARYRYICVCVCVWK